MPLMTFAIWQKLSRRSREKYQAYKDNRWIAVKGCRYDGKIYYEYGHLFYEVPVSSLPRQDFIIAG
jgi:hypothetical protein